MAGCSIPASVPNSALAPSTCLPAEFPKVHPAGTQVIPLCEEGASSKPSGSTARQPAPCLQSQQLTSHAGTAPSSPAQDKREEASPVLRALPDVARWRRTLFGAVAWAEDRGDPGDSEQQALPSRALHLPLVWNSNTARTSNLEGTVVDSWGSCRGCECVQPWKESPALEVPVAMWPAVA